ncbi:MAG TPA: OmpA family protein [Myxococcota bacterium]|nr:OmpA family protein [Myxococcota bacterium]
MFSKSFCKVAIGAVLVAFGAACTTDPYTGQPQVAKTAIGAVIGSAAGAGIGALADRNHARGALIGAGAGALAGGAVGGYMDYQEKKLRERLQGTGVSVTRVGNEIVLNMPGNVTFDVNRAEIRPDFYPVLNSVVLVVQEYQKTIIEVSGFTDNTGSDAHNLDLSNRRSAAVASYLKAQQVNPARVLSQGFGEQRPIASNETAEGRQQNRRVELRLVPLTA